MITTVTVNMIILVIFAIVIICNIVALVILVLTLVAMSITTITFIFLYDHRCYDYHYGYLVIFSMVIFFRVMAYMVMNIVLTTSVTGIATLLSSPVVVMDVMMIISGLPLLLCLLPR